ncbi:MAG: hypothetical protein RBS84_06750, partial [Kiritimatiellia bacterium]|nr:hypothetical protein [Kiritimatiellia bacterium]
MQGLTPLLVWVWLAAVFCIGTGVAQAALSEGFNGTGWGTSYGTYTVNSWTLNSVFRDTTTKYEGAAAIRFATTAGTRNIISPSNSGGIGTVSFWHRRWSAADGTVGFSVYISTNGTAWSSAVGSGSSTSDTYSQYSVAVNNAAAKYVKIELSSGKRWLVDLVEVSDAPASTPTIAIADNGTVGATTVATGTVAHVLVKFSAAVTVANAELNTVAFTTAGTYDANDLTNLKLWYSADATLNTGSDSNIKTITGPAAAGAKSFTGLSQAINSGSTGYFFITAD